MMKTHYYFSWFSNGLPKKIADLLHNDICDKKSLVTVCTKPSGGSAIEEEEYRMVKDDWLGAASIIFDEYHFIDYKVKKEDAHDLLKHASVIYLHGGDTHLQNAFIKEYDLEMAIRNSNASVIMGMSAGAENMAAHYICAKSAGWSKAEGVTVHSGIGLDAFTYVGHFDSDKVELIESELFPISKDMTIYAQCDEATMRVKNGNIEILGDVYLINNGEIKKMPENNFKEENRYENYKG